MKGGILLQRDVENDNSYVFEQTFHFSLTFSGVGFRLEGNSLEHG